MYGKDTFLLSSIAKSLETPLALHAFRATLRFKSPKEMTCKLVLFK